MLAALHTLAALAETDRPLSDLLVGLRPLRRQRRDQLGCRRPARRPRGARGHLRRDPGVELDHLDGLTVTTSDWWFNVRASNTEPLLRLNAEGKDAATMVQVRDAVLGPIRKDASS